ncbi:MAG: hypothetical protein H7177_13940 [Rhizobacter sp.]|nr:hypothetical protein [Bacteriovorax sp.]
MKNSILILSLLLAYGAQAKDMSGTESYKESTKEMEDGSVVYIGKCSTHQDYEKKYFTVDETLVKYFEPRDVTQAQMEKKLKNVEKELIVAAAKGANQEDATLSDVDDLTVEKITSTKFAGLDLYRLNIGVGGGNGMFLVYNRILKGKTPVYELISNVFDGDLEFCDSAVWIK